MNTFVRSLALAAGGVLLASAAQATTVATFADPAVSGATPLFHFDFNLQLLTGGWSGLNLNLETPGLPAADFPNSTFTMTPVPTAPAGPPGLFNTGPGTIQYFDAANNPLLTITFTGGLLNTTAFGSSDFIGQNVVFSGPIIGFPVTQEAFSFSFGNPVSVSPPGSFTATASFTSSATIPAPGAATLLGLGGLVLARRRR